jgi:Helix-turn-helix domain
MNVSPKVGQGFVPTPSARQALAAEGGEQKAIMHGEGKQSRPKDPILKRVLSHPCRLAVLDYLMQKRETGTDEEELVEVLDLPAPKVKYHLLVLRGADLIARADDPAQGYIATASAAL